MNRATPILHPVNPGRRLNPDLGHYPLVFPGRCGKALPDAVLCWFFKEHGLTFVPIGFGLSFWG